MIFSWLYLNERKRDYEARSESQLLDCFKTKNWERFSSDERLKILRALESEYAVRDGRTMPARIVSTGRKDQIGYYNSMSNCMGINVNDYSSYEVLDTYIHEKTHAHQANCMRNGLGYNSELMGMMKVENARDELGNLYNYKTSTPLYDLQYSELDSNYEAAKFMLGHRNRFEKDKAYKDYISERTNHFQTVNTHLTEDYEQRKIMQNMQVETSLSRGDISRDTYFTLMDKINNKMTGDLMAIRTYDIGNKVSQLNQKYSREHIQEKCKREESSVFHDKKGENQSQRILPDEPYTKEQEKEVNEIFAGAEPEPRYFIDKGNVDNQEDELQKYDGYKASNQINNLNESENQENNHEDNYEEDYEYGY